MLARPLLAFILLAASSAAAQPSGFVHPDGARFVVDGRAIHVVGANVGVMHGDEQRAQYRATLGAAAADGLSLVRVWALGEYPADAPARVRSSAFRVGPDGWIDESFAHLDAVLAEARRLGLRVVIVLANRWGDYGGVPQYLAWAGAGDIGHSPGPLALTAFWDSPECEAQYREHVRRIVSRVNSVTGVRYADDPTIFAWELINEAEAAGALGDEALVRWVDRQATFIRELDPSHMISAGYIGYAGARDRSLWTRVCELPVVSYCDSHAYPLRDGRVRTAARLGEWIDDRVRVAHYLAEKPLLFGEFGVPNEREVFGREPALWIATFVARVLEQGAAGAMLWTYLPSEARSRTYAVYVDGEHARDSAPLRRALAQAAERARSTSPIVRPPTGPLPAFDATEILRGPATVHHAFDVHEGALRARIDPLGFERARFESAGTWGGDPGLPHFYGGGAGEVTYLVRRPPGLRAPRALRVRLRASSELPGSGGGVSDADTSSLTIAIDGVELGTLTAPPDDGLGRWIELTVDDPERVHAIAAHAIERVQISASAEGAGGVCLYGRTENGEPAGIELEWIESAP